MPPNGAMVSAMSRPSGRPSGRASDSIFDSIMAQVAGRERRVLISQKIREHTGESPARTVLPSVHLAWGLRQMQLRGWSSEDWGNLLNPDETVGDGPICLLESVQAPMDAPGMLDGETPEQFYLRLAFVKLDWQSPLYLSHWNDEQDDFGPVQCLMLKAIELAAEDEANDRRPWEGLDHRVLQELFGITTEALQAIRAEQDAERDAAAT